MILLGIWCAFEALYLHVAQLRHLNKAKKTKVFNAIDLIFLKLNLNQECVSKDAYNSSIEGALFTSAKQISCICSASIDSGKKLAKSRIVFESDRSFIVSFHSCQEIEELYLKVAAIDYLIVCLIVGFWITLKRARLKLHQIRYKFFAAPYLLMRNIV